MNPCLPFDQTRHWCKGGLTGGEGVHLRSTKTPSSRWGCIVGEGGYLCFGSGQETLPSLPCSCLLSLSTSEVRTEGEPRGHGVFRLFHPLLQVGRDFGTRRTRPTRWDDGCHPGVFVPEPSTLPLDYSGGYYPPTNHVWICYTFTSHLDSTKIRR